MSVGEPGGGPAAAERVPAATAEESAPEPVTGPVVTVTVTCVSDGHSHAVPDTELTGMASGSGCYRAVCGHVVTAAPMVAPEGAPCRLCEETREMKSRRRTRKLARLLGG